MVQLQISCEDWRIACAGFIFVWWVKWGWSQLLAEMKTAGVLDEKQINLPTHHQRSEASVQSQQCARKKGFYASLPKACQVKIFQILDSEPHPLLHTPPFIHYMTESMPAIVIVIWYCNHWPADPVCTPLLPNFLIFFHPQPNPPSQNSKSTCVWYWIKLAHFLGHISPEVGYSADLIDSLLILIWKIF